jgi:hypothetical protein
MALWLDVRFTLVAATVEIVGRIIRQRYYFLFPFVDTTVR